MGKKIGCLLSSEKCLVCSENRTNMDDESARHNKRKRESILHDQRLNLQCLSLKDLRDITNDFSYERLIGQGGFGRVYKVRLNPIFFYNQTLSISLLYPYHINREF